MNVPKSLRVEFLSLLCPCWVGYACGT